MASNSSKLCIEEIQDLFYEESSKTYSKLRDSKIVKELNIF